MLTISLAESDLCLTVRTAGQYHVGWHVCVSSRRRTNCRGMTSTSGIVNFTIPLFKTLVYPFE